MSRDRGEGFDLSRRLSNGSKLARRGASIKDVATSADRSGAKLKRKRINIGAPMPLNSTRQAQERGAAKPRARDDGVKRAAPINRKTGERARALGDDFQPPAISRPKLETSTVATVSPTYAPLERTRSRKSAAPSHWDDHSARSGRSNAAAGLEAVANTEGEDDATYVVQAQTVRATHPDNFSPASKPARGQGGRWSTEDGDRQARLAGQKSRRGSQQEPTPRRVTRAQSGGDDAAIWGAKPGNRRAGRSDDGAYRGRFKPVEDSPSTKRAKEKQAELKKQGNQLEEAITLSSSDEEPEGESEDEPGVVAFQLDDETVFFGAEAKPAAKKIRFSCKGLQIPSPDVWGDGEDADIVPYEEIESIVYDKGRYLFLSVTLQPESNKLKSLLQLMPGMQKRKYQDDYKRRILLPLHACQADVFAGRCQQIKDEFIREALVDDEETFLMPARAHQVIDLLMGTPYKVRRHTRSSSTASSASDSDTLMVYYPDHGKSRVKITKADFNVLGEHEMLNDSAIDFYLKWIEHEVVMQCPNMLNQFLFFGTFFFKKMTTQVKAKLRGPRARLDRLASVEKYNSRGGESIWNRRFLIVPINEAFHWSLAIACIGPPDQNDEDKQTTDGAAGCMHAEAVVPKPRKIDMLYFDSLGHKGRKHCKEIIEYLNYKWNKEYGLADDRSNPSVERPYRIPAAAARKRSVSPTNESNDDGMSYVNLVQKNAPNQENGHDCGVFLLEYAERFVKDIILQTTRGRDCSDYIQSTEFHQWFQTETVKQKRTHIQDLLKYLEQQRMAQEKQEAEEKMKDAQPDKQNDRAGKEHSADGDANAWSLTGPNADTAAPADIRYPAKQVPAPRQKTEVWIMLKNQAGNARINSFIVPDDDADSVEGTINLMQKFKVWFERGAKTSIGDVQKLKLFRRLSGTDFKPGKHVFELYLDKSPDENFLVFGDNLLVQSEFYELAQAAAETIVDGGDEDDFQSVIGGETTAPDSRGVSAVADLDEETTAPEHPAKLKSVLTARIPRRSNSKNSLPQQNSLEQKPADPDWVHEQTRSRTKNLVGDDTEESESDDSTSKSAASAAPTAATGDAVPTVNRYGKRPRPGAQHSNGGDENADGQQIERDQLTQSKKQRGGPPPLPEQPCVGPPPLPGLGGGGSERAAEEQPVPVEKKMYGAPAERSVGYEQMLRLAHGGKHLNTSKR